MTNNQPLNVVVTNAFGAVVSRAPELLHGKTSEVFHHNEGVLEPLNSPFIATRYHSLVIDKASMPAELLITAETSDGIVMGVRHRDVDVEGVQFHPESVLTESGYQMLGNWLESIGLEGAAERAKSLSPMVKF